MSMLHRILAVLFCAVLAGCRANYTEHTQRFLDYVREDTSNFQFIVGNYRLDHDFITFAVDKKLLDKMTGVVALAAEFNKNEDVNDSDWEMMELEAGRVLKVVDGNNIFKVMELEAGRVLKVVTLEMVDGVEKPTRNNDLLGGGMAGLSMPKGTGPIIIISHSQAVRITEYFAKEGLIDRTYEESTSSPDDGWYIGFEPREFLVCWYVKEADLLGRKDILGVRTVLQGHARKAWDEFIESVKARPALPTTE